MAEKTGDRPIDSVPGISDARLIGSGGFGQVFVAREEKLHREVAVKVLSRPADNGSSRQFEREMAALGALSQHPNIVTLLRAGVTPDGYPFLVMEYASGGSLDQHLKESGPFAWQRAFEIGADVCKALTEADGSGVTHQDVKPPNIFLSAYDVPLLGDFGVARLAGVTATLSQSVTATFSHASPEQVEGFELDGRTDIYSLGSTLYQLITGHAAFAGPNDTATFQSLLARLATAEVPRNAALPEHAYRVLARSMAKNPDDRYQTAAELAEALRAALSQAAHVPPPQVPPPAPPTQAPLAPALPLPEVSPPAPSLPLLPPALPPAPALPLAAPALAAQQPRFEPAPSASPPPPRPAAPPQAPPLRPPPSAPGSKTTGPQNSAGLVVGAVVAVIAVLATGLWVSGVGRNGDGQATSSSDRVEEPGDLGTETIEPTAEPAVRPTPRTDSQPAPEPTRTPAPAPTAEPTAVPDLSAGVSAASIEEWEELWAAQRAAIVASIRANGYGVTNGVLTGPGGFSVALDDCPAGWSDTEGIDNGVITIGHTTAQSGVLAAYGNIGVGLGVYFDYLNAQGGIGPDGLLVELITRDDAYNASLTIELVDELLAEEQPFLVTTLGTPSTFAVHDDLNAACIPHPLVMTAHSAWGDPEGIPWTSGMQLSYSSEAIMWGSWIEDNLPGDTIKVAALVMDNDFGLSYEQAFDRFVATSDRIEVSFVRHDPATLTLANEMATLAADDPDVLISMTAGEPCLIAIEEAERAGLTESVEALFTASVCKNVSTYLAPAGQAADGWYVMGGGFKDTTSPLNAGDAYIQWMRGVIGGAGLNPDIALYSTGFGQFGWAHGQALLIAADLDGGLSRSNYLLALRSLEMTHPLLFGGIDFSADGGSDAFLVEGSDVSRFNADAQVWEVQEIIDLNGQTPNCAWDPGRGCE